MSKVVLHLIACVMFILPVGAYAQDLYVDPGHGGPGADQYHRAEPLSGSASATGAVFCHPIPLFVTIAKAGVQCTGNIQAMPAGSLPS